MALRWQPRAFQPNRSGALNTATCPICARLPDDQAEESAGKIVERLTIPTAIVGRLLYNGTWTGFPSTWRDAS